MVDRKDIERKTRAGYKALRHSSLGIELAVSVVIGLLGGMWVDSKLGTEPWLMVLGLLLGLTAGIRSIVRAYNEVAADAEDEP